MLTYSDSAIVLPWVSPIKLKKSLKTTGDLLWVFEDGAIWINVMQAKSGYNLTSPCFGNSEISSQKWPFHNNLSGREQLTGQLTR